jgi:hypothetical protein
MEHQNRRLKYVQRLVVNACASAGKTDLLLFKMIRYIILAELETRYFSVREGIIVLVFKKMFEFFKFL